MKKIIISLLRACYFLSKRDMRFGTWKVRSLYLQEVGWGAWTGLIWLRIGTGGGLL
jgi:hypothetical protein